VFLDEKRKSEEDLAMAFEAIPGGEAADGEEDGLIGIERVTFEEVVGFGAGLELVFVEGVGNDGDSFGREGEVVERDLASEVADGHEMVGMAEGEVAEAAFEMPEVDAMEDAEDAGAGEEPDQRHDGEKVKVDGDDADGFVEQAELEAFGGESEGAEAALEVTDGVDGDVGKGAKGVVRRGGVMIDQDGDGMGGETFCDGLDVGAGEGLDAAAAEFDAGGPDLDGFWLHSESAFGIAERG
jgi:hypothetical protein